MQRDGRAPVRIQWSAKLQRFARSYTVKKLHPWLVKHAHEFVLARVLRAAA